MGVSSQATKQGPAMGNVMDALALLANPELLQQRLQELRDAEERATKAIEAVGPIEDIQRLRSEAEHAVQDAINSRNMVGEEAERITNEAREEAEEIVRNARIEAHRLLNDAQAKLTNAGVREAESAAAAEEISRRVAEAHEFEALLDKRRADLDEQQKALDEGRAAVIAERRRLAKISETLSASLQPA